MHIGKKCDILYYMKPWCFASRHRQEANIPCRSTNPQKIIVNELGFTKASVSIAMKKLRENGYIAVDGEGNLTLLAPGREIAERIYSRHRLLTHFFMQLGVDEKTAAEDACKAEHILSEQTLEKIRERAIETDAELGKTVK